MILLRIAIVVFLFCSAGRANPAILLLNLSPQQPSAEYVLTLVKKALEKRDFASVISISAGSLGELSRKLTEAIPPDTEIIKILVHGHGENTTRGMDLFVGEEKISLVAFDAEGRLLSGTQRRKINQKFNRAFAPLESRLSSQVHLHVTACRALKDEPHTLGNILLLKELYGIKEGSIYANAGPGQFATYYERIFRDSFIVNAAYAKLALIVEFLLVAITTPRPLSHGHYLEALLTAAGIPLGLGVGLAVNLVKAKLGKGSIFLIRADGQIRRAIIKESAAYREIFLVLDKIAEEYPVEFCPLQVATKSQG